MLLCWAATAGWASPPAFSEQAVGSEVSGWQLMPLKGTVPTHFEIVRLDGRNVLRTSAADAAAGLVHTVAEEGAEREIAFRWKIAAHVPGTDMTRRSGDDYAARIYLTFARDPGELPWATRLKVRLARLLYGQEVPAAAICYVWDPSLPVATSMPNAYSDTVMMLVAESGPAEVGWRTVRRNYAADYRQLFGAEAPPLTSVIVATDTDDTGASAGAWFGDIVLR